MGVARAQIAVAVALLLVGGAALLARRPADVAPASPGEVERYRMAPTDIRAVRVHAASTWRVSRDDGAWFVEVRPGLKLPAEPGLSWTLFDAAAEAGAGVAVDVEDAAATGLDAPLRVEIEGPFIARVEVGEDAPVGQRTYVRVDGVTLAAGGGVGAAVRVGPEPYVLKRLWAGAGADRVVVSGPDGRVEAIDDGAGWQVAGRPAVAWAQGVLDLELLDVSAGPAAPSVSVEVHHAGLSRRFELGLSDQGWRVRADDGRTGLLAGDVAAILAGP